VTYRLLALFAVLALLVSVLLLSGAPREGEGGAVAGSAPPAPGYAARQARLVQTGEDGQPLYTLDAAEIQQQPEQELVTLQEVTLGFRDTAGNQWSARADRGELAQASGVVQLEGNVRVDGPSPTNGEAAEISTEHLAFDTRAQIASTHDPVTILMSGRELHAQGLSATLKERHLQLESDVHGSFAPLP
jgi:LPS export ABC transporter protein LptC